MEDIDEKKAPVMEYEVQEEEQDPSVELRAELDHEHDLRLRALADFENYKRNAMKRIADARSNGIRAAIDAILPVMDDIDIACTIEPKNEVYSLIRSKFINALDGLGVKKIEPQVGDVFDVSTMNAIAVEDTQSKMDIVLKVARFGYTFDNGLQDAVIRHADVVVGKPVTDVGS